MSGAIHFTEGLLPEKKECMAFVGLLLKYIAPYVGVSCLCANVSAQRPPERIK